MIKEITPEQRKELFGEEGAFYASLRSVHAVLHGCARLQWRSAQHNKCRLQATPLEVRESGPGRVYRVRRCRSHWFGRASFQYDLNGGEFAARKQILQDLTQSLCFKQFHPGRNRVNA
jgi:hypothetical protein